MTVAISGYEHSAQCRTLFIEGHRTVKNGFFVSLTTEVCDPDWSIPGPELSVPQGAATGVIQHAAEDGGVLVIPEARPTDRPPLVVDGQFHSARGVVGTVDEADRDV